MRTSAKILGAVLSLLLIATAFVWYAAIREDHRGALTLTALNVGQGDAILVETPSGRSMLIDGGPDDSVLRQLGQARPFYDRTIDIVIATDESPQQVGGLASTLARYSTPTIIRSAAVSDSPQAQAFTGAVSTAQQSGARLFIPQRGDVIDLGDGALLEFFFPDRDASRISSSDGCLMFKLLYGRTSFFFACGSPAIENYLATLDGSKLGSDVLLGTGSDPELFTGFISPQFAIVPCADATSSAFASLQIQVLDTCDRSVTLISDGQTVHRR